jgi:hypothetical protein
MAERRKRKKSKVRPATPKPKQTKPKAESDVAGLFRWLANAERTMQMKIGFRK